MDSERELGSDLTVDQIQNFIAESESNMSNLDSQLRSIQILRDKERSRIRLLRYLMAPIHVLPVEVLAEIFLFSVGGTHDASEVFRVSHVCYCWRQLAHNTPRLWMHCSITLRHHPGPSDAYITVLKTWLDLSLRLPLFLSITTRHYDFDLTDVLKTIIPVTSRLTTLDLDLTAYWRLVPLFKVPLEALEVLRLKYWYPESSPIDNWEALDLSCAPQLRSVFLPEDYEDFVFNIPWHQLTHLGLINNPDVCLEVLPRCLNLEHADIGSFAWDDDIDLPEQPIFILPNLRSLQYKIESLESDMGQFVPFFKRLSLPALTSLKLCLPEGSTVSSQYISWSAADFSRFQAQTNSSVSCEPLQSSVA
ncbi:hypothetical protein B0H10DRAFT_1218625 [Mycena sp. CBHHK59/15]|nr:hypothetical protein B0H10DRAFT_1218625 [Mycena sp. CBHHK59/15]